MRFVSVGMGYASHFWITGIIVAVFRQNLIVIKLWSVWRWRRAAQITIFAQGTQWPKLSKYVFRMQRLARNYARIEEASLSGYRSKAILAERDF
jgi:hypothetical protein